MARTSLWASMMLLFRQICCMCVRSMHDSQQTVGAYPVARGGRILRQTCRILDVQYVGAKSADSVATSAMRSRARAHERGALSRHQSGVSDRNETQIRL